MEVLRRCPLAIAQQLVYYANAVLTAVLGRVTSSMSVAPLLSNNLKQKRSPTFVAQLHLPPHDLFSANLRVQHHRPSSWPCLDPQKCLTSSWESSSPPSSWSCLDSAEGSMMMMNWCLMSSDVMRHIRDKLWPMPKHGAINLYVHGNQKAR